MKASLPPTQFSYEMDKKLGACLKTQSDKVVIELLELAGLEKNHLKVLKRWCENFKAMGGDFAVVGVNDTFYGLMQEVDFSSQECAIYRDFSEFKKDFPEAEVLFDDPSESVLSENDSKFFESSEEPLNQEMSITKSIDLNQLKAVSSKMSVSEKLNFLKPSTSRLPLIPSVEVDSHTLIHSVHLYKGDLSPFSGKYVCSKCLTDQWLLRGSLFEKCETCQSTESWLILKEKIF